MFKIINSAAAFAALIAVAASTPAAAFIAPAPDAIAQPAEAAGSLVTTVSCGGVDCDAPSQRGYTYQGRYGSGGRHAGTRNRWRDSRSRRYGSNRRYDRRWRGYDDRREVRRAVRNLIGALADRRW